MCDACSCNRLESAHHHAFGGTYPCEGPQSCSRHEPVEYAVGGYLGDPPVYALGGVISRDEVVSSDTTMLVHADDCFIRAEDIRHGHAVCSRPGHPTATSSCRGQVERR